MTDQSNSAETEREHPYTIRSRVEFQYCPVCGEKTTRTDHEYGIEIECPEHGELLMQ